MANGFCKFPEKTKFPSIPFYLDKIITVYIGSKQVLILIAICNNLIILNLDTYYIILFKFLSNLWVLLFFLTPIWEWL